MDTRLARGRRYARAGQVLDLDVRPGEVGARVQGSRRQPYQVRVVTPTIALEDWLRVEQAMATRAVFLAKLLAGEMPRDIEEAFAEARLSLFPSSGDDISADCSCPDWANPCKHIAAVYYLLAEAFDDDPFLIFRWRGRDRDELLADVLARPRGDLGIAGARDLWDVPELAVPALDDAIDHFWEGGDAVGHSARRPRAAVIPDAILRGLERGMIDVAGTPLAEVLAPAYPAIAAAAEQAALRKET